ncbi:MAG: SIMPL domain-containing protein [Patescibacteria group bacterium]|nr:SIMPL domain-containing protein [Patescibacteria group bacterium]MCL5224030.1 SIMPL domain-containing protein [Patescibacteria group bacterium]
MQNNLYQGAKLVLVIVIIIAACAAVYGLVSWGNSLTPAKTMTVTADAQTNVSPDLATVSFSEVTIGSDPTKIEAANATQINSAINFVKQEGISSEDIATTNYNLSPNYDYTRKDGKVSIISYTITETETLKIKDFTKIAPILAGLVNLGVNQIGQVTFSVEDPDSQLASARKEAFAKAQLKAQQMAVDNGVKLGGIISVSENTNNIGPLPIYNTMSAAGVSGRAVTPTIEPGTQQLTDYVSITYAIQ